MIALSKYSHFQFVGFLLLSVLMFIPNESHAGGVALGATRIIYPQNSKQVSLPVINSSDDGTYLIQSWVSDAEGKKSTSFAITPPLFVIHPRKENVLRIIYGGKSLPTDRESVFYLNVKAIPSFDSTKLKSNTLQIATQSVIKIFVRPDNLIIPSIEAPKNLKCKMKDSNTVTMNNLSPYYISMVKLSADNVKLKNAMVPPKSSIDISVKKMVGHITFQAVNDYGALTSVQNCSVSNI